MSFARGSVDFFLFRLRQARGAPRETASVYALSRPRNILHSIADLLPFRFREPFAETFLRRAGAPAPAAEHVFQYRLSLAQGKCEATVAKGADNFYARQYRQYLNPTMGVFAITATHAALAAGEERRRGRRTARIAMNAHNGDAAPILVLDNQSVATPLYLPPLCAKGETHALRRWLSGHGTAPSSYAALMSGDELHCSEQGVAARRCSATGAMLQLAQAALRSRKLAILALHPHDPDAMGLHVTLFGVEALTATALMHDYALDAQKLAPWRRAADEKGALLCFLVGGVEEAFTQCSQNLFVKRPCAPHEAAPLREAWGPHLLLARLMERQFEILQATVSASGLPGVSPRNGDIGLAGFIAHEKRRTLALIPYFVGNAVHGHAAKLWSNPNGALMIWDDHSSLTAVTLAGPARVAAHDEIERRFPDIAAKLAMRRRRNGALADPPEYWFVHEVNEIVVQDEPVPANVLDPVRSTCSIHAAGPALHGKKPAYFNADSSAPYDMRWQHEREHQGRPRDPSGASRRYWEWESAPALEARRAHLAGLEHSA